MFACLMFAMLAGPPSIDPGQVLDQASSKSVPETLGSDRKGRPTIAVRVNGRGPFEMVVDTAAQTSLVSTDLAAELKLPDLHGGVRLNGATQNGAATLYGVDRLQSNLFDERDVAAPGLPNGSVTDARGIIGMEMIGARKLIVDREAKSVSVAPSGSTLPGFVSVKGRVDRDGLVMIPISINGRTVQALVDSGADGTIAGRAVLDLLGWNADDPRLKPYGAIRGASGTGVAARVASFDTVQIGPVKLSSVPIVVTDWPATSQSEGPAVILGSDLLNLLTAYAVDFGRGELQIRIPPPR